MENTLRMFNLRSAVAIFGMISMLVTNCYMGEMSGERISGDGNFETETRNVDEFNKLGVSNMFNIILRQGTQELTIEAESNILEHLETEVSNGKLRIRTESGYNLKPTKTPNIYISMAELERIHLSGAGTFKSDDTFEATDVELDISGAVDIDLELNCETLKVSMSGAADMNLEGEADDFRLSTSGAGNIDAEDFVTEFSAVSISGAASARVHVTDHLKASISGLGSIEYKGNPEKIDKSVSGLGSVKEI